MKLPHTTHTSKGPVQWVAKGDPIVEQPAPHVIIDRQAARIRELEGALRALLSITRPGPHDRSAKDEPHVEICRRWNDARRVLGGAA